MTLFGLAVMLTILPAEAPTQGPEGKALAYLIREVPQWPVENKCFSCHNNGDAVRALYLARQRGLAVPDQALAATTAWLQKPRGWDHNGGEGPFSDKNLARLQFTLALFAAHEAGLVRDRDSLAQAADLVAAFQDQDGSWPIEAEGTLGSPATYGITLATALARKILAQADRTKYQDRIARAEAWLRHKKVLRVLDAAGVLIGLDRAEDEAARRQRTRCLEVIRKGEGKEGGWGPYINSAAEVFDTALVLLALRRQPETAEVRAMMQRGRAYLIQMQQKDGSWRETTRPANGSSYAQHISTTGWALQALLLTQPATKEVWHMTQDQAAAFARLALQGIQKEFPNKPADVLNQGADVKGPRAQHPAFYGCFDWHSAVHSHWMLVRLLRMYPDLPQRKEIRAVLAEHLTAANLQAEADSFNRPNMKSFERPYGWAWLLKLAEELHGWDDPDARKWSANLKPLTDTIVARYIAFFPRQTYPIRTGVHPNTAFGLSFALDYARAVDHKRLRELVEKRSRTYFARDAGIPAAWEPDGADFFSPSLLEADLMRRVLPPAEFQAWLRRFLPDLAKGQPRNLLEPATVSDRSDPQIVHLDGLNLSRAWCLRSLAAALPKEDPARPVLLKAAALHAEAALPHVASGDYAGEHWLASFAVYLLTTPVAD